MLFLHELPGLVSEAFDFARRLNDDGKGFTVYLPLFFGAAGQDSNLRVALQTVCWGSEFDCRARHSMGTIVDWVERLCLKINADHGNRGLAVVGNCLTGAMPLALMARTDVKPHLKCVVLSQPVTPMGPLGMPRNLDAKRSVGVTDREMAKAVDSKVPVLAQKFDNDPYVPKERMMFLQDIFKGKPFEYHEVPHDEHCSAWGSHAPSHTHAILTLGYCPDHSSNAWQAYHRVEIFIKQHLGGRSA